MVNFIKDLCVGIYNLLAHACLWTQSQFSNTVLIVGGVAMIIIFVGVCYKMYEDEGGGDTALTFALSAGLFYMLFGLCQGVSEFVDVDVTQSLYVWSVVIMCGLLLIFIGVGYASITKGMFIEFLIGFICMVLGYILLSKYIAIIVCAGCIAIGGGSKYIGTFTDKNGNSYDIYKKD